MTREQHDQFALSLIAAALGSSAALIILQFFRWDLVEVLTPFLEPFLFELPIHGGFLIITIAALVYLPIGLYQRRRWQAIVPLGVNLVTAVAIFLIPFAQIIITTDFYQHRAARERVVAEVMSGTLKPNVSYNNELIHLPVYYGYLSRGGNDIVVTHVGTATSILFFTYRGVTDNYAGFVYRSDDQPPTEQEIGGILLDLIRFDTNWYWFSTT